MTILATAVCTTFVLSRQSTQFTRNTPICSQIGPLLSNLKSIDANTRLLVKLKTKKKNKTKQKHPYLKVSLNYEKNHLIQFRLLLEYYLFGSRALASTFTYNHIAPSHSKMYNNSENHLKANTMKGCTSAYAF